MRGGSVDVQTEAQGTALAVQWLRLGLQRRESRSQDLTCLVAKKPKHKTDTVL